MTDLKALSRSKVIVVCSLCLLVFNPSPVQARRLVTTIGGKKDLASPPNKDFMRRSKRHVADLSITDKASRSHAANERQIALLQLLQTADTATGGKCGCLFVKRTGHRHKCHCDFTSLLSTLINSLRSSESGTGKELDRVVRSMDDSQRSVFLKLVLKELHKARRMRALGRNRLMRLRRRVLLRKRFLSKYPRAAFDGKQMISF
ncbi:uncharacterized protein LOC143465508 [Clavelina lepadiformis]|uniref:uncharacterized protein LOC143465508 n=1 Tax=Clavelina lepadiformis TaxID=159417 RepID=UPI004041A8B2